jgi:capsular exopolysaccharide synthesis family protein
MTDPGRPGQDLRHYLRLAWRRKWLLLAVVVVIPLVTYLLAARSPSVYETSTLIQVQQTAVSSTVFGNQVAFSGTGAESAARLLQTTAVARVAARNLGEAPDQAGALIGEISVSVDDADDAGYLTISARGSDPNRAAEVANAFAAAIGATRTNRALAQIDQTIATLEKQASSADTPTREQLAQQLQQLRGLRASQGDTTQVLQPAPPGTKIAPTPERSAKVGFVLALLVAAGLVPLMDVLDRRLRNPDELQRLLGVPLLGTVPEEAFPGHEAGPAVREAFQTLRAALTHFNIDRPLSKIAVTSPGGGEGKTTVATNLAIALAQSGRDVILVDGDLRRPRVAARFGRAGDVHFGLGTVLSEHRHPDEALLRVEVDAGRLRILPGDTPPNPSVLLASQAMRDLLTRLAEQVDTVVIDTPPLLSVSDALPLMDQVGTVLLARMDRTSRDDLYKASELISNARGQLLGLVATGIQLGGVYGYRGYGYGYRDDKPLEATEEAGTLINTGRGNGASGGVHDPGRGAINRS